MPGRDAAVSAKLQRRWAGGQPRARGASKHGQFATTLRTEEPTSGDLKPGSLILPGVPARATAAPLATLHAKPDTGKSHATGSSPRSHSPPIFRAGRLPTKAEVKAQAGVPVAPDASGHVASTLSQESEPDTSCQARALSDTASQEPRPVKSKTRHPSKRAKQQETQQISHLLAKWARREGTTAKAPRPPAQPYRSVTRPATASGRLRAQSGSHQHVQDKISGDSTPATDKSATLASTTAAHCDTLQADEDLLPDAHSTHSSKMGVWKGALRSVQSLRVMRHTLSALSAHYSTSERRRSSARESARVARRQLKEAGPGAPKALVAAAADAAASKAPQPTSLPEEIVGEALAAVGESFTRAAREVTLALQQQAPDLVAPVQELLQVLPRFQAAQAQRRRELLEAAKAERRKRLWHKASFASTLIEQEDSGTDDERSSAHGPASDGVLSVVSVSSPSAALGARPQSPGHSSSKPSFFASGGAASPMAARAFSAASPVDSPTVSWSDAPARMEGEQRAGSPLDPMLGQHEPKRCKSPAEQLPLELEGDIVEDVDLITSAQDGVLERIQTAFRQRRLAAAATVAMAQGRITSETLAKAGSFSTVAQAAEDVDGGESDAAFSGGRLHHAARKLMLALRVSKAMRCTGSSQAQWGNSTEKSKDHDDDVAPTGRVPDLASSVRRRAKPLHVDVDEGELAGISACQSSDTDQRGTTDSFTAAARSSNLRSRLATEAIAAQAGEALAAGDGLRPGLAPSSAKRPMNLGWGDSAAAALQSAQTQRGKHTHEPVPRPHSAVVEAAMSPRRRGAGAAAHAQEPSFSAQSRPSTAPARHRTTLETFRAASNSTRRGMMQEPAFRPSAAVFAITSGTAEHRRVSTRDNTLAHAMTAEVGGIAAPLVRRLRQHIVTLEQESEVQTELASRAIADLRSRLGSYHEGKTSWSARNGAPVARRMEELQGTLKGLQGSSAAQVSALSGMDKMLRRISTMTEGWMEKAQAAAQRVFLSQGCQTDDSFPLDMSLEGHFRTSLAVQYQEEIAELKARRRARRPSGAAARTPRDQSRPPPLSLSHQPSVRATFILYAVPPLLPVPLLLGSHAAHGPGTWLWRFVHFTTTPSMRLAAQSRQTMPLTNLIDTCMAIFRAQETSDAAKDEEGSPRLDIWEQVHTYFKHSFGTGKRGGSLAPKRTLAFLYSMHAFACSPVARMHPWLWFVFRVFGLHTAVPFGAGKQDCALGSTPTPRARPAGGPPPREHSMLHPSSKEMWHPASYATTLQRGMLWDHDLLKCLPPPDADLDQLGSPKRQSAPVPGHRAQHSLMSYSAHLSAIAAAARDASADAPPPIRGAAGVPHRYSTQAATFAATARLHIHSTEEQESDSARLMQDMRFVGLPVPADYPSRTTQTLRPGGGAGDLADLPMPEYLPKLVLRLRSALKSLSRRYEGVLRGRGLHNASGHPSGDGSPRSRGVGRPPSSSKRFELPDRHQVRGRASLGSRQGALPIEPTRLVAPFAVRVPCHAQAALASCVPDPKERKLSGSPAAVRVAKGDSHFAQHGECVESTSQSTHQDHVVESEPVDVPHGVQPVETARRPSSAKGQLEGGPRVHARDSVESAQIGTAPLVERKRPASAQPPHRKDASLVLASEPNSPDKYKPRGLQRPAIPADGTHHDQAASNARGSAEEPGGERVACITVAEVVSDSIKALVGLECDPEAGTPGASAPSGTLQGQDNGSLGHEDALERLHQALEVPVPARTSAIAPEALAAARWTMTGFSVRNMSHMRREWAPLSPLFDALRPFMQGVGHLPSTRHSPFSSQGGSGGVTTSSRTYSLWDHLSDDLLAHAMLPSMAADPHTSWNDAHVVSEGSGAANAAEQLPPKAARSRLTIRQKRELLAKEKFVASLAKLGLGSLRSTFQSIDGQGAGSISVRQLTSFMAENCMPLSSQETKRILRSMVSTVTPHSQISFLAFTNAFREVHASGGMLVVDFDVVTALVCRAHLSAVAQIEANWAAAFALADSHAVHAPGSRDVLAHGVLGAIHLSQLATLLADVSEQTTSSVQLPFPAATSVLAELVSGGAEHDCDLPVHALAEAAAESKPRVGANERWRVPGHADVHPPPDRALGSQATSASHAGDTQAGMSTGHRSSAGADPQDHEHITAHLATSLQLKAVEGTKSAVLQLCAIRLFDLCSARLEARLACARQSSMQAAPPTQAQGSPITPGAASTWLRQGGGSPEPGFGGMQTPPRSAPWLPLLPVLPLCRASDHPCMVWSPSKDSLVDLGLLKQAPGPSMGQTDSPTASPEEATNAARVPIRIVPTLSPCMVTLYDLLCVARAFNLTAPQHPLALGYTLTSAFTVRSAGASQSRDISAAESNKAPARSTPKRSPAATRARPSSAESASASLARGGWDASRSVTSDTLVQTASVARDSSPVSRAASPSADERSEGTWLSPRRQTSLKDAARAVAGRNKQRGSARRRSATARIPSHSPSRPTTPRKTSPAILEQTHRSFFEVTHGEQAGVGALHSGDAAPRSPPGSPEECACDEQSSRLSAELCQGPWEVTGKSVPTSGVVDFVTRQPEHVESVEPDETLGLRDLARRAGSPAAVRLAPFSLSDNADASHAPRIDPQVYEQFLGQGAAPDAIAVHSSKAIGVSDRAARSAEVGRGAAGGSRAASRPSPAQLHRNRMLRPASAPNRQSRAGHGAKVAIEAGLQLARASRQATPALSDVTDDTLDRVGRGVGQYEVPQPPEGDRYLRVGPNAPRPRKWPSYTPPAAAGAVLRRPRSADVRRGSASSIRALAPASTGDAQEAVQGSEAGPSLVQRQEGMPRHRADAAVRRAGLGAGVSGRTQGGRPTLSRPRVREDHSLPPATVDRPLGSAPLRGQLHVVGMTVDSNNTDK